MVYRMLDYYGMLERKYKLPVKQFVIFLGSDKPTMPTELDRERLKFSYPLVSLSTLDYHIFLNSNKPEEIILGVLANFKGENPEYALKQILIRIKETSKGDFSLNRYFNQLRVLAQLRKLESERRTAKFKNRYGQHRRIYQRRKRRSLSERTRTNRRTYRKKPAF